MTDCSASLLPGYGNPECCSKCGHVHSDSHFVYNNYCAGKTRLSRWWLCGYTIKVPLCSFGVLGEHIHRKCERCHAEYLVQTLDRTPVVSGSAASVGSDGVSSGILEVPNYGN